MELITDFESYNQQNQPTASETNWVGDLMLECSVDIQSLTGTVTLELVEGLRVYRCVLDLEGKKATLTQNDITLAKAVSPIDSTGKWNLRFANFDDQLTVWAEDQELFGDGIAVEAAGPEEMGPRVEDALPVGIAVEGSEATVSSLRVFRDTYYTQMLGSVHRLRTLRVDEASLQVWRDYQLATNPLEFQVGENEFFMLGDNSPHSSDSRAWQGTHFVNRRLLLGRALVLYWPAWRWKFVR